MGGRHVDCHPPIVGPPIRSVRARSACPQACGPDLGHELAELGVALDVDPAQVPDSRVHELPAICEHIHALSGQRLDVLDLDLALALAPAHIRDGPASGVGGRDAAAEEGGPSGAASLWRTRRGQSPVLPGRRRESRRAWCDAFPPRSSCGARRFGEARRGGTGTSVMSCRSTFCRAPPPPPAMTALAIGLSS